MNKLKWAAIQPLTGGMYLGAEEAFGYPAEWILTYDGLDNIKYNKEGNITSVGNEAYLLNYLKKQNREVPYYKMHRTMFDCNIDDLNPTITCNGIESKPNYNDIDIIVAVPVCSGLSMVTSANDDTKDARNCNMLYLANLALKEIKPKIYIFENAPTFMGSRGDSLRKQFEELANNTGYSIIYYKTDSWLHYNCQKRPRTFIMFIKKIDNKVPVLDFEDHKLTINEFFNNIPNVLNDQNECISLPHNYLTIDFFKYKYGDNWLDYVDGCLMKNIVARGLLDELLDFMKTYNKMSSEQKIKTQKYIDHIKHKTSMNLNWYGFDACYYKEHFPSIQFKSIKTTMHPIGNRFCTIREFLELMGMPHDFEWFGDNDNLQKIGQNVPVKTAKFITQQAINILSNNIKEYKECSVLFINNINKKIEIIK